jgi:hypothetical protein
MTLHKYPEIYDMYICCRTDIVLPHERQKVCNMITLHNAPTRLVVNVFVTGLEIRNDLQSHLVNSFKIEGLILIVRPSTL